MTGPTRYVHLEKKWQDQVMDAMGVVKPPRHEVMIEVTIVRRSLLLKSTINYSNLIKGFFFYRKIWETLQHDSSIQLRTYL